MLKQNVVVDGSLEGIVVGHCPERRQTQSWPSEARNLYQNGHAWVHSNEVHERLALASIETSNTLTMDVAK